MKNKIFIFYLLPAIFLVFFCLFFSASLYAQLWQALPPYNILWPLWSPLLSPQNPITGVPTPLVSELTNKTVLPLQPSLVWDPGLPYYYLLYNDFPLYGNPILKYWDSTQGYIPPPYTYYSAFNPFEDWPPDYLTTYLPYSTPPSLIPAPIALPVGYETLLPFDPISWIEFYVNRINTLFESLYGVDPYLLTVIQLTSNVILP